MKYFLFISLMASVVFAEQTKPQATLSAKHLPSAMPAQGVEKARFTYREYAANREDSFIIQATKCNGTQDELWVEKFETKAKVATGEVNTIHIYARAGDCRESKLSSLWSQVIKIPKSKNITQVYITVLSDTVTVL